MAKLDEMSFVAKLGVAVFIALILGAGCYYGFLSAQEQANQELAAKIKDKKAENERLRQFEPKLAQINQQMIELQQQLDIQKQIVPDEKDADQFIKILHDTAAGTGIEIRRYTALPIANHEFYSEVPFAIDIDGPYYSVVNFFEKVAKLERIVNIGNLQMANTKETGAAKVKTAYPYAPGETVVASCTATTFFSHDQPPAPAAAPAVKR